MKKTIISVLALVLVLRLGGIGKADLVDISVATDKTIYLLGEDIVVSVMAYNPNQEPITLGFTTSMQSSYLMDNTYDWKTHHGSYPVVSTIEIPAYDTYTWNLTHGVEEMQTYTPPVGMHTIVGEVINYGQSLPIEFEVIPEPSTFVLLFFGFLSLRVRSKNN